MADEKLNMGTGEQKIPEAPEPVAGIILPFSAVTPLLL